MYPKLTSEEIVKLQNSPHKLYSRFYVILYEDNPNTGFAFIASKKVGNAVIRNQSKRYLREFIRLNYHTVNKKHILIICKKTILNALTKGAKYSEFEKDLHSALKKIS